MALNAKDITKTTKMPVEVYTGLAVPAADAELTIGADGTPDATENPNAKRVGFTENGAVCTINRTETEEFVDEQKSPVLRQLDQVGMMIKCRALQVLDADTMATITQGVGTAQTVTGKKKFKIGEAAAPVNTGIAAISPTRNDPTKFLVFHIYSGRNIANIEFPLSRQTRAGVDVEFAGDAIVSRAKPDALGAIWWTTA
jgi:hypothetical protein